MREFDQLTCVRYCKVIIKEKHTQYSGLVLEDDGHIIRLQVVAPNELGGERSFKREDITISSGFSPKEKVLWKRRLHGLEERLEGIVLESKIVANQTLLAVHFAALDKTMWLPFEHVRLIQNQLQRFLMGRVDGVKDHAERFRLKTLGYGIKLWNQNTGSLSSLDIDPLPHQINLVHHILDSGNLNWLIADDVGLGKTIETGMLLTALKYREQAKRILLVTPAGLTKQWKDELYHKFSFEDFRIFGDDFTITEAREWKMYDHVIASIDRLKSDENRMLLAGSGEWDLIVFDEAHRLTRSQVGNRYFSSDRYDLAKELRGLTENIVLLTATPHQGKSDQFQSLLMLLRPELEREIIRLSQNPEILSEMVYRNNKSKVTDLDGRLLFKGKETIPVSLPVSEKALKFDRLLQKYLKKSAEKSAEIGGTRGRAIGFVIAIYRKLAASSVAAILNALKNRRQRINQRIEEIDKSHDERYVGEFEENYILKEVEQFIDGEEEYLNNLIQLGEEVKAEDLKLQGFLEKVIAPIINQNPDEKIVVFTEYLSTQSYIESALKARFGSDCTSLINGSMSREERELSIQHFNNKGQFIISTEAGGEGINLQHACHILINFDLPWNPMRLVQRIGRIYRYGQEKRVLIFNVFSEGTADDEIVRLLYKKIDQVVDDLCQVSDEYDEGLKDDIFGNVADLVDVESALEKAIFAPIEQTEKEIEEALKEAKDVSKKQQELFSYVAKYDSEALAREFVITLEHINAFLQGMFKQCGIEVLNTMYEGEVLVIKIPEDIRQTLGFRRGRLEITTNRKMKIKRPSTEVMDLNHPLMSYLIDKAITYDFWGASSKIVGKDLEGAAIVAAMVKWQNLQGTSIHQDLVLFSIDESGRVDFRTQNFSEWLLSPAQFFKSDYKLCRRLSQNVNIGITSALNNLLLEKRKPTLIPHDAYIVSAAWIESE